jgi:hypothetical protein
MRFAFLIIFFIAGCAPPRSVDWTQGQPALVNEPKRTDFCSRLPVDPSCL